MSDDTVRLWWHFEVDDVLHGSRGELGCFSITQLDDKTLIETRLPEGEKKQYYIDMMADDALLRMCGNYDYTVGEEDTVLYNIIQGSFAEELL